MTVTDARTSSDRAVRRELLAGERNLSPRLAPAGDRIAFVRTTDDGQELWLHTIGAAEHRLASHPGQALGHPLWTADGETVVYRHAPRGSERWRLAAVRPADGVRTDLAAEGLVREVWAGPGGTIAYSVLNSVGKRPELYHLDLSSPNPTPELIAAGSFHRWLVDGELRARGGIRLLRDGSAQIVVGESAQAARALLTIGADDAPGLSVERFSLDGARLYLLTAGSRGTRRLLALDCATGATTTVYEHESLDIESYPIAGAGVWFDPVTGEPDLCSVMGQRLSFHPLAPRLAPAVSRLAALGQDAAVVIDRSADDRTWLTVRVRDDGPICYDRYLPATAEARQLFTNRPGLEGTPLSRLEDFRFTAGDGLEIPGYLMRPAEAAEPLPTVVLVHGGPAGRDYWRFHAEAQYLAELGYLTLHVNYRGSRGFGTDFRLAGDGEWGRRMQQDLYDAVDAAVERGLADPRRVAFFGGSYGGYTALLAACTRPDLVRCAVAVSPPCDLVAFTETPPAYWQPLSGLLRRQILGRDGLDREELERRSPAHALTSDCAPLLIAHGVRDPRVPVTDIDAFVAKAEAADVPVRYLRFDDEGHHVVANGNRRTLFHEIETFLEAHLVDVDRQPADSAPLHAR
jgi:dipeptidyl aminopeptidase/acylaminoacyl peptidase